MATGPPSAEPDLSEMAKEFVGNFNRISCTERYTHVIIAAYNMISDGKIKHKMIIQVKDKDIKSTNDLKKDCVLIEKGADGINVKFFRKLQDLINIVDSGPSKFSTNKRETHFEKDKPIDKNWMEIFYAIQDLKNFKKKYDLMESKCIHFAHELYEVL